MTAAFHEAQRWLQWCNPGRFLPQDVWIWPAEKEHAATTAEKGLYLFLCRSEAAGRCYACALAKASLDRRGEKYTIRQCETHPYIFDSDTNQVKDWQKGLSSTEKEQYETLQLAWVRFLLNK